MSDLENWQQDAKDFGWEMPAVSWWKKLMVIRHIRATYHFIRIEFWYAVGLGSMIGYPSGYDQWVLYGIWNGLEK